MDLAESLRAQGFRRWYERQLIESHAWLVTGFLSLIMTAIAIEVIAFRESFLGMLTLLAVGGAGATLCLYSWLRFNKQLFAAERIASQATCPDCRTYGRFTFVSMAIDLQSVAGRTVRVRCRHCGREWSIA